MFQERNGNNIKDIEHRDNSIGFDSICYIISCLTMDMQAVLSVLLGLTAALEETTEKSADLRARDTTVQFE